MSKKAVAVIGGIAGVLGLAWLVSRVKAKPEIQVAVSSNPIKTVLLLDDQVEVTTPAVLTMKLGVHKFSAIPKSPDLVITYGFHEWTANGKVISHDPIVQLNITRPISLIAQYIMVESGRYPATLPL